MPKTGTRSAVATPQANSNTKRKLSQEDRVLGYIQEHGSITAWDAFAKLKITRLSGRIYDLREKGYDIDMNYETSSEGARYGVYTLKEGSYEGITSK